jgi:hypothetical protein
LWNQCRIADYSSASATGLPMRESRGHHPQLESCGFVMIVNRP